MLLADDGKQVFVRVVGLGRVPADHGIAVKLGDGFHEFSRVSGPQEKGLAYPGRAKVAVVPTKPIPRAAFVRILGGHHVPAFEDSPEGWQGAPQLERGGEPARQRRAGCAAPRLVSGRDQLDPGTGMAALDRGDGSRDGAAANAVAIP